MQSLQKLESECLTYFKSEPVWRKVLAGFLEKYASFGKFTGKVKLKNLSADEIEVLEGFFGQNFHGQKSITISAEHFAKALENSRYKEVLPDQLLKLYFGKEPVSKKEQKEKREQEKQAIEDKFFDYCQGTYAEKLVPEMLALQRLHIKDNLSEWRQLLFFSADIVNSLPYRSERTEYLPVFAAGLTKNPHAFDKGTVFGDLLYELVKLDLNHRKMKVERLPYFPSYERQKSFLSCGILLDDVSNYVLLYHVAGVQKNGSYHKGLNGFFEEEDMLQVPLTVLTKLSRLESPDQTLYIDENPSVFAARCMSYPESACMCMNGQPKLAALVALELFAASGTKVYYSGDFDPEGLWIAQRLAYFYPGNFEFLNMDTECYEKCISDEPISDVRLKQLERITDERLLGAVQMMRREKKSGYQEGIL